MVPQDLHDALLPMPGIINDTFTSYEAHNNKLGTGLVLSENTMTLTYRGIKYERPDPSLAWMLNERLAQQRKDFEEKLDMLRMKNNKSAVF